MRMHYHIWLIGAACALVILAAGELLSLIDSGPAPGPAPEISPSASPAPGSGWLSPGPVTASARSDTHTSAAGPRRPTPVRQPRTAAPPEAPQIWYTRRTPFVPKANIYLYNKLYSDERKH